jgi:uncharacterized protein YcfL
MLFIKNHIKLLLLISLTFAASACVHVSPITSGIGTDKLTLEQEYNKHLQINNKKLAGRVHINDIKSRKKNDLLHVNLSLISTYKKSLQLQYQFQWFDADGFVIEAGKSPWQPFELHGLQTTTVASLAPSPYVTTFSLYVREVPKKFYKH